MKYRELKRKCLPVKMHLFFKKKSSDKSGILILRDDVLYGTYTPISGWPKVVGRKQYKKWPRVIRYYIGG